MNKSVMRCISVILAFVMVLSLSVCAFAEGGNTQVKHYDCYCSIGDSVADAIGYSDEPGTFPRLVKNAVGDSGEEHFFSDPGMRTKDFLIALDELYSGMTCEEISQLDEYYICDAYSPEDVVSEKAAIQEMLMKADLITLQLGPNDIGYAPIMTSKLTTLSPDSLDAVATASAVEDYLAKVWEGFDSYSENLPRIIRKIQQMKEGQDYAIVLVGIYNCVNGLLLSDNIEIPIGNTVSLVTGLANAKCRQIAEEYGCLYADISNVETGMMMAGTSLDNPSILENSTASALLTHPAYPEGYAYIARQIINQLPAEDAKPDTDIRIDLGSVKNVSSVCVDGIVIPSTAYSFDAQTHMLTVGFSSATAHLVTVTYKSKTSVGTSVYQLSYDSDEGYRAYLMYANKDLGNSASIAVKNVCTIASGIGERIKALLGK